LRRKSKVGSASLLLVGVLINPSDPSVFFDMRVGVTLIILSLPESGLSSLPDTDYILKCRPDKDLDTMEGAVRLFAGEFNQSTLTVPGEDEKSAAWVVTPLGGYCRQVFLAGALVEVQEQGDMLSARLADPTGGFDLVCGGKNTSLAESIRKIPLPSFVSVSGRAQLYRKEGKAMLTIRPDQVQMIDRHIRDQWVITTATATLARLETVYHALKGTCTDKRTLRALSHYSLTIGDLSRLADMVAGSLMSVRPPQETDGAVQVDPKEIIMEYIQAKSGPRGVAVEEILEMAWMRAISREAALAAIESLIVEDECYQPQKGFVKPL
jgi:RPA family protein